MNISRTILHYDDGSSDKVYIVDVNRLPSGEKPYVVMTTWGRRTAPRLSNQIKDCFNTEREANRERDKLVHKKRTGRDAYQLALSKLTIPGLASLGTAADVLIESSTVQKSESRVIDDSNLRRSIKL